MFVCSLINAFSVTNDDLERDVKVSSCIILGTILAFTWSNWGKPWKTSVRIAGLQAKTLTCEPPIMKDQMTMIFG
jgi:hypothetical protein